MPPNKVKLSDFLKRVEDKTSIRDQIVRINLAYITSFLFGFFLFLPFLQLSLGQIMYEQAIEVIKTIASILGPITGLVWGFYFNVK